MIKKIKISEPELITDEEEIRYLNEIMPLQCEISELRQRIAKAQNFIRNESSLNDAEIDELAMILEGDI